MTLSLHIHSLYGLDTTADGTAESDAAYVIIAKFRRSIADTDEQRVTSNTGSVVFNQNLRFEVRNKIQQTDTISLSLMKRVKPGSSSQMKLGEFSMILQSVVEDEPITIEERILDLNHNALLPISVKFSILYEPVTTLKTLNGHDMMSPENGDALEDDSLFPLLPQSPQHTVSYSAPFCGSKKVRKTSRTLSRQQAHDSSELVSTRAPIKGSDTNLPSDAKLQSSRITSYSKQNSMPARFDEKTTPSVDKKSPGNILHATSMDLTTSASIDSVSSATMDTVSSASINTVKSAASHVTPAPMNTVASVAMEVMRRQHRIKLNKLFHKKPISRETSSKSAKRNRFPMALSLAKMLKKTVRGDSASNVSQVATFSTADSATEMSDESTDTSSTLENVEPEFLHPYSTKCKQTCLERVIRPSKHNYPQDFQVSISIIEIRKLQGLNLNPMVEIHVGDVKKKTSSKESTNCPFFDEYFVFDYHLPKQSVLEKIVTFTVFSVATFTKGKPLCQLKVELAAIYAFPGHQVYHKWAPLMSCDDQGSEDIQGYMKIDIAITGKDSARPTADVCQNSADENFDKACERKTLNLLLPPGCGQFDRQKAKIHVKIYKAEDLPFMNIGILANMKKAFTGEKPDLVDPYVQVSFAGVMYKTSVKKGQCSPVWNEQLTFTEALPALCSTINIKLKDKASVTDDVIGIYHIDLMEISNTGTTGFLPTFGPCWVNLYGSKREVNVLNEHRALNSSQGEGIAYRGRLLVAVSTEPVSGFTIVDETSANEPADEITRIPAVPEAVLPKKGDFLLAGAVLEATMINPKYKNQAIQFELSIGNLEQTFEAPEDQLKGVTLRRESVIKIPVFDSHDKTPLIDSQQIDPGVCSEFTNISAPRTPKTNDKRVYSINYGVEKPCLYVQTRLEDTTARMHSQNLSDYLAEYLSNGIADVKSFLSYGDMEKAVTRLTAVAKRFAVLCISCSNIWSIHPNSSTKLDRERGRVCKLKLENLSSKARTIRNTLTYNTIKTKIRQCLEMLTEVRALAEEPQGTFPDVFIWMIVGGKRVAYFRLLARDILYTPETEVKNGKWCSKLNTILLRLPGKKSAGAGGWQMQAQLSMILWLGCLEDKESFLENLPPGYRSRYADIPRSLTCSCEDVYQFRAHLYQARALIGSDNSGLSDPYAVVKFGEHSVVTKTIYETLSPTWNQMLLINNISLPYTAEYMKINPPIITIELYDEDNISGGPEFLGRTFAFPLVKLSTDKYEGPTFPALLQWWHIRRGQSPSGELLASFELFQKPFDPTEIYQLLLTPQPEKKRRKNALGGLPFEVAPQDIAAALSSEQEAITPIPGSIRPVYSKHRIEVMFWGVRELKKLQFMSVNRPRVDVECAGHVISSVPITDANVNPNFSVTVMHTDVELPDDETYCPPITIRCVDCRNFGRFVLVGTHTIRSLQKYLYHPKSKDSFDNLHIKSPSKLIEGTASEPTISRQAVTSKFGNLVQSTILQNTSSTSSGLKNLGQEIASKTARTPLRRSQSQVQRDELDEIDWSSLDWWSKYYASVDKLEHERGKPGGRGESDEPADDPAIITYSVKENGVTSIFSEKKEAADYGEGHELNDIVVHENNDVSRRHSMFKHIQTLKIYDRELEAVKEFEGFAEWLHTFNFYRGKKIADEEDEESRLVGKFKGCLQIYKNPPDLSAQDVNIVGGDPKMGMFSGMPANSPVKVLVRIYIVLGKELHPADMNGKADPYLIIKLGQKVINDIDNYVPKNLNPIFGRCFEQEVTFPMESQLCIQVMDWDMFSKNDLIGETKIDLENRYYSRHRATCGLNNLYHSSGYNAWRDRQKPSLILAKLCTEARIDPPHYRLHQSKVTVANREFYLKPDDASHMEENLALEVLKHWSEVKPAGCALVPEHVETRSLYSPEKPGVEQGKLQMWIDMFPLDAPSVPKPVDISPRKPIAYELRVTIWNADEVILEEDDFFTGEKSSDIYIKGFLTGPSESQSTDVHYRSLTGEGNFNWRFILPFDYLLAEQKIVMKKKESIFSWDETEVKLPAKLTLQVWDADHISADDFLGSFSEELTRFPRGAKSMERCDLITPDMPTVNLFKQKRIKGWWPFLQENRTMMAGKVEAEIELLTAEEAEQRPVGEGRNSPEPLDKPNRPDTSFIWFLNPLKSMNYLFCKRFKKVFIRLAVFIMVTLLVVLLVYNIPRYAAKRIVGA